MKVKKRIFLLLSVGALVSFGMGIGVCGIAGASTAEPSTGPLVRYDFEAGSVSGQTVKNSGSKSGMDAKLVTKGDEVKINNGRLTFNQSRTDGSEATDLGHFRLPDNLFEGLTSFSFVIDVYDLQIGDDYCGFFTFLESDPAVTTVGDTNAGLQTAYSWNGTRQDFDLFVAANIPGEETPSAQGGTPVRYMDSQYTFTFDGSTFYVYVNGALSTSVSGFSADYFQSKVYNRIGGYLYDWGRGSIKGSFDNIRLYDRVLSQEEMLENAEELAPKDAKAAAIYYDFSSAKDNKVENLGTKANSEGTIVSNDGDVKIENGKLVLYQKAQNEVDLETLKKNGYFLLPSDLFKGVTDFTIQFEIEKLALADGYCGLMTFSETNPAVTAAGDDNVTSEISWAWNNTYACRDIVFSPWGETNNIGTLETGKSVLTIVFSSGKLMAFCDNQFLGMSHGAAVKEDYFQQFLFNKIGGYLYDWGRSSARITIDNFAFYDYAFNGGLLSGICSSAESISFDLGSDAEKLIDPVFTLTDGTTAEGLSYKVRETSVDFATAGYKYYTADIEGQLFPARVILHTRDLKDWSSSVTIKYEDASTAFPATIEAEYSDGTTGIANVEWEEYQFSTEKKTVKGVITDAAGRTASALMEVTGQGAGLEDLKTYIEKLDAQKGDYVTNTYEALMKAIKTEYDAAKAIIDGGEGSVADAYNALVNAYEKNKGVLISVAELKAALVQYDDGGRAQYARAAEREAYETAESEVETLIKNCDSADKIAPAAEALKTAREELFLAVENTGFSGVSEQENGLGGFTSQNSTFWRQSDDVSYKLTGEFAISFTLSGFEYVQASECAISFGFTTNNNIQYRVGVNAYDSKYSDHSLNGVFGDVTNVMGADGTFPEPAQSGSSWTTNFNFDSPVTIRLERIFDKENEGFAYYYFYLIQNGKICHAYYDYYQDVGDAYFAFGSLRLTANVSDLRIEGLPVIPAYEEGYEYSAISSGVTLEKSDNTYTVAGDGLLLSKTSIDGNYDLLAVDFTLNGEVSADTMIRFALGTQGGFRKDYFSINYDDGEGKSSIDYYHYSESDYDSAEVSKNLESGRTYTFVLTRQKVGEYVQVGAYVIDGETVLASVEARVSWYILPAKLLVYSDGAGYTLGTPSVKDISAVIVEEIDEDDYTPDSVKAYKQKLDEIGLGIVDLLKATEEELEAKKVAIAEAEKLLELTKIVGYEELPDLSVELNAQKVQLPTRVRVTYDTGKTELLKITWDTPDTSKVGTFVLKGYVEQKDGSKYEVTCNLEIYDPQAGTDSGKTDSGCGSVAEYTALGLFASMTLAAGAVLLRKRKD